jgi:hypothetical protein
MGRMPRAAPADTAHFAIPLKKAASGFRVLHAFRPVLSNDVGGVQLGGSGDTADDRPTARARMGDLGLCKRLAAGLEVVMGSIKRLARATTTWLTRPGRGNDLTTLRVIEICAMWGWSVSR